MATDTVLMDYDRMGYVAKSFRAVAQMLRAISKVLQIQIQILRAAAFASMGTSLVLARYYENIKNKVDKLAKICEEFSRDIRGAIGDHKRGDVRGRARFGEGVR